MKMIIFLFFIVAAATAVSAAQAPAFIPHATIAHQGSTLVVHASSPRPVEQALSAVRREYGLVLDYEEGPSSDSERYVWVGTQKRWKGGDYTLAVSQPDMMSQAFPKTLVASILSNFRAAGARNFIEIYGTNGRISVAPSDQTGRILDIPIVIPPKQRTIDATIQAILSAITAKTGKVIERGGIVDNETAQKDVVVGNQTPVAARILLAEALDQTYYRRFWIQTWEPDSGNYYIGIQPVVRVQQTPDGETREFPVR